MEVRRERLLSCPISRANSPGGEGVGTFLLSWGIDMAHSKMLHNLLHVLMAEQGVETGLVCNNIPICKCLVI